MAKHNIPIRPVFSKPENPATWAYLQSFYLGNPDSKLKMTPVMPSDRLPDEPIEVSEDDLEECRMLFEQEGILPKTTKTT